MEDDKPKPDQDLKQLISVKDAELAMLRGVVIEYQKLCFKQLSDSASNRKWVENYFGIHGRKPQA